MTTRRVTPRPRAILKWRWASGKAMLFPRRHIAAFGAHTTGVADAHLGRRPEW